MNPSLPPWSRWLALAAWSLDAATGLGLVLRPAFTLHAMGVPAPGAEALGFVRFVGVFVAAVGGSYLWALARGGDDRLRAVLEFTLLFRLGAGLFTAAVVAAAHWPAAWLTVSATDFALVVLQSWLLRRSSHG